MAVCIQRVIVALSIVKLLTCERSIVRVSKSFFVVIELLVSRKKAFASSGDSMVPVVSMTAITSLLSGILIKYGWGSFIETWPSVIVISGT
ncbi:MAG: hypothetical protein WBC22_02165 [Sedimentisphaerales bacterium]